MEGYVQKKKKKQALTKYKKQREKESLALATSSVHAHVCVCSTNDHTLSKCSVSLNLLLSDAHSLSLATSVKYFSSLNQALPTQLTARHPFYLHLKKKDVDESTMPAF